MEGRTAFGALWHHPCVQMCIRTEFRAMVQRQTRRAMLTGPGTVPSAVWELKNLTEATGWVTTMRL